MNYNIKMYDNCSVEETSFKANGFLEARRMASSKVEDWCREGYWGIEGASIQCSYILTDETGHEEKEYFTIDIASEEEAIMLEAKVNVCNHKWTSENEGGCDDNPGVFSTGGTGFVFHTHCEKCQVKRIETITGSQKNPGEHDTIRFVIPD